MFYSTGPRADIHKNYQAKAAKRCMIVKGILYQQRITYDDTIIRLSKA
jgi:hypothetical protein